MYQFPDYLQIEFDRFIRIIQSEKYDPQILIASYDEKSPIEEIVKYSREITQPDLYLDDFDGIPDGFDENVLGEDSLIFVDCRKISDETALTLLKKSYHLIKEYNSLLPVFIINKNRFTRLRNLIERTMIPISIMKVFLFGSIKEKDFSLWFSKQIPVHLPPDVMDIIFNGTGLDFNRATRLRIHLFPDDDTRLFFIGERNEIFQSGYFKNDRKSYSLKTENGINLRIPVKIFIFDTNVFFMKNFAHFVNHIGDGEYFLPRLVIDELHHTEEKMKRKKEKTKISIMKSNLKLLEEKMDKKNYKGNTTSRRDLKNDLRIIQIARETNSIIVTGDKQLHSSCSLQGIPVVLINI